ncbi:MAG: ATP-binding cassette domain-containing protein, partial [Acetanaerobacterium sp.]
MIRFEHVSKSYGSSTILDNISFEIKAGEFVVFIGPSGCGKTTTLKTINRLIEPDKGKIYIDDKDVTQQNPVELRRTIGYVIQQIGLFPNMTVEQNIAVVPKLLKYPKEKCQEIVRELLELVDMPYEENAHKY